MVLKQIGQYKAIQGEAAEDQLYIFLMRFASMVLEILPRHMDFPGREDPTYTKYKALVPQVR